MPAGVVVGQLIVVESKQVQPGGVDVANVVDALTASAPISSVAPMVCPALVPPPANHMVMALGLWSRP